MNTKVQTPEYLRKAIVN